MNAASPRPSPLDRLLQGYARSREHPGKLRVFGLLHRVLKQRRRLLLDVPGGYRLYLSPDDHIERCIIFDGWHEEFTSRFLLSNLRSGGTALIAGAHIGYHVLHAARAVGENGIVVACEPEPPTLERLLVHLRINAPRAHVAALAHALGDAPGYIPMQPPPEESAGTAALLTSPAGTAYHAFVDTIENTLSRLGLRQIDFLLLDIEGFERRALLGLGAIRPPLMVIESDPRHHERLGESQTSFFDFVRSLGYSLHDIFGTLVQHPGFYPETNLVAVRNDQPSPAWPSFSPR